MATPTIPNGEEHFFPIIYEGNGAGQRVGKFVPFTDNGTIDNSVIFNDDDSSRLYRQISAGNRKTWTISCWFKLGKAPSTDSAGFWVSSPSDDGGVGGNPSPYNMIFFQFSSGQLEIQDYQNPSYVIRLKTNRTFEDTSKFYHLLLAVDTTQSTTANRVRMYIDGDEITSFATSTYPSLNADTNANRSGYYDVINVGYNQYWDGYLAEFNFIDGTQLTPSTFGLTDTSTGRWIPKTLSGITYGTNGYRLEFGDSSALGDDTSGNTNDFTATNLASTDQTTDSPTQNFATHDPSFSGTIGLSEGNLKVSGTQNADYQTAYVGKNVNSGKWYFEVTATTVPTFFLIGLTTLDGYANAKTTYVGANDGSYGFQFYPGSNDAVYYDGSNFSYSSGTSLSNGDVIGVAYDADTGEYWLAVNNTWVQSGNPSTGANPVMVATKGAGKDIYFGISSYYNVGVWDFNFGQRSFAYTAPTGFVALQQDNLPETAKGVSGLVWAKSRDNTGATLPHQIIDSSRGVGKRLITSSTVAEAFNANHLSRFLKGGYATGDINVLNTAGDSMVAWNWVANGGTTTTNNNGSITSTTQANTTAGFSIVQYTGTGSNATVGHSLSSAPEWILFKNLDNASEGWSTYHTSLTSAAYIVTLNNSNAQASSATDFNSTAPTSSVFSVGTNARTNNSSQRIVAYCWHGVDGFSKFGKYTGNGSSSGDGTFVYTGFKPAWIMIKETGNTNDWMIWDNARFPLNPTNNSLFANLTQGDNGSSIDLDVLSNGFKCRTNNSQINRSSGSYIFCSFAEHPFVGDGVSPVTAR